MDVTRDTGNADGDAGGTDGDDTARTAASGLDAGGHEPAPRSEDPVTQEARDGIQREFDTLEATVSSDAVWDEAARRADEEPAPGTPAGDAAAGAGAGDAAAGAAGGGPGDANATTPEPT
jgi:hypothetical protein